MKKILFFLILFPALSCSDLDILDKKPYTHYERDIILTPQGMDLLLTGTYSLMSRGEYYGASLYLCEAAKGPDFFVRNVTGGYSFYLESRFQTSANSNGNARPLWLLIYRAIRNATILIENIEDVLGDTEELRRIKGEAYFLRGLCYFDLMRLFAYPPLFSVPGHARYNEQFRWGVPILNSVEVGSEIYNHEIRREPAETVYAFILDQFERAERLLEGRTQSRGRVNAAAVKAMLIRTHLYLEDWDIVIEEGEKWIAAYGSHYSMIPYDSYPTSYHKPYTTESIWELEYSTYDNLGTGSINYWVRCPTWDEPGSEKDGTRMDNNGYSKLGLTWGGATRGFDFLTYYPNDVRQYLICDLGLDARPEYKTIRRYIGDPFHSVHNIPVIRLPEIYLSIAEAHANKGNMGEATEYTSMVSQPRRKANASITSSIHVLDERRREFILEGQTFWDCFRTARDITGKQIIESIAASTVNFGLISNFNYQVVYPIPYSEMNVNPAMRDQQNPGYGPYAPSVVEEDD